MYIYFKFLLAVGNELLDTFNLERIYFIYLKLFSGGAYLYRPQHRKQGTLNLEPSKLVNFLRLAESSLSSAFSKTLDYVYCSVS
jgi:hypothetical protein